MAFNPAGTQWSVASLDNDGNIGSFNPTPWEFHDEAMNAGTLWYGGYVPVAGSDNSIACQIMSNGAVTDTFEVVFVTADRLIATKAGSLYRFGKKL